MADTDRNKALIECHKCSSSFLSIVRSHPLKIPASVLEKIRAGSCLKLFLIDCSSTTGESPCYSFCRRLSAPQDQSGHEGVKRNLHVFDTRDRTRVVQAHSQAPFRLCYLVQECSFILNKEGISIKFK